MVLQSLCQMGRLDILTGNQVSDDVCKLEDAVVDAPVTATGAWQCASMCGWSLQLNELANLLMMHMSITIQGRGIYGNKKCLP
jgi:hypothetical protein